MAEGGVTADLNDETNKVPDYEKQKNIISELSKKQLENGDTWFVLIKYSFTQCITKKLDL